MARMLKESGVATLEKSLENGNQCMAMAMCKHGASTKEVSEKDAVSQGDAFYIAIKTFAAFLNSVQEVSTRSTKQIDALTGALRVGSTMGEGACRTLYPCPETDNQIQGRRGEVQRTTYFQIVSSLNSLNNILGVCLFRPLVPGIRSQLRDVWNLQPGSLRRSLSGCWSRLRLPGIHLQS